MLSTTTATLLGRDEITSLTPMQSIALQTEVQAPWNIPAQLQWIFAYVDRENVVFEGNESDNQRLAVFFGQTGPCATGLEFDDPLTIPGNASLSLAAGGTLHPSVVAPCVDPATTLYVITWTGSGTTPGVPLSPTLTLPLNPDSLTDLALAGLNGPIFGQFLGVFDPFGIGRATFTLPPAVALPTGTTHFAAVLMGATELFTAVSNPIALNLTP